MPFIGNQPALSYTSFAKQDFSTSATTSYTLDHPVANGNEIALFINFVRQEPTTAYTASGTSLTLTSATSATDDMYCVFLGKAVQTVNPPSGSVGTSQLDSSLDFSSKTITLASNMKNTPAFFARVSGNFSVSDNTTTLLPFATENFDTDNAFDNTASNYKFTVPSGKAGKYYFAHSIRKNNDSLDRMSIIWKINGVTIREIEHGIGGTYAGSNGSIMFDLNVGDYVQVYLYAQHSSASTVNLGNDTWFMGFKLI